ncbi:MAG: hypothetical protein LAT67_08715 [Balneolales bacterium]|nr:hypothetical protein [Balneolales bacterium]
MEIDPVLISIQFQIAILALAVPVLLTVIVNLDRRYESIHIIRLFQQSPEIWLFGITLVTNLFFVAWYVLSVNYGYWSEFEDYRRTFLLGGIPTLTAFQVIFLLFLIRKVVIFYTPDKLLKHLEVVFENEKELSFRALGDLLVSVVKRGEREIAIDAISFTHNLFQQKEYSQTGEEIHYPKSYYQFIEKLAQTLLAVNNKGFVFLEYRVFGATWLRPIRKNISTSNVTFHNIWIINASALEEKRQDLALHLWRQMHQYSLLNLRDYERYGVTGSYNYSSTKGEKRKLFEFMSHINALALYYGCYEYLNKAFRYTQNEPPKHPLLPKSMSDIFDLYYLVSDDDYEMLLFSGMYQFPDETGIDGEKITTLWFRKSVAILYLRQFTLRRHLSYEDPVSIPGFPKSQSKMKIWLEGLPYFLKFIEETRKDKKLLKELNMPDFTDKWFEENNQLLPEVIFDEIEIKLKDKMDETERAQDLSEEKLAKFKESSKDIISEALASVSELKNDTLTEEPEIIGKCKGKIIPFERTAFLDNIPFHHANFDSFVAEELSADIKTTLANSFHEASTENYSLSSVDMFKAIDKLLGGKDRAEYVLVNAAVFLPYIINHTEVKKDLSEEFYKGTPIFNLKWSSAKGGRALYLMKKQDLPFASTRPPLSSEIKDFSLIDLEIEGYDIWAGIIDLRDFATDESEKYLIRQNHQKYAVANIVCNLEISFSESRKIVELRQIIEGSTKNPDKQDLSAVDNSIFD